MNKYVYLGELQKALEERLAENEVRRIMDYYENYMIEAMEYGKSEAEVLEELQDPRTLANNIIDGLQDESDVEIKNTTENPSFGTLVDDLMESTSQTIEDALKVVDKTVGNISDYLSDVFGTENFFEDSDKLAKDMTVLGDVKDEMNIELDDIEEVIFKIFSMPVYAYFTNETELKLEVPENANGEPLIEVRKDDNCVVVREKKAKVFRLFNGHNEYIKVGLPLSYRGKIYFKCDNGKLQIVGKHTKYPSTIEIKCDNGNVEIKDAILGNLNVKCANGKIDMLNVIAYKASLKCSNGVITYDMIPNDYAKNLYIKASNGLIKINDQRWSSSRVETKIPARNESQYELSVEAKCDNGIIRLKGF